jgi:mycothiol synthase
VSVIEAVGPDDVDAIVEAVNAHSIGVHGVADTTRDDVLTWLEAPGADRELEAFIVTLPDGSVGGYGDVQDDNFEHRRYWIDLRLRPGCNGSSLLRELEARALRLAAPDALLRCFTQGADVEAHRLVEAHGYSLIRHGFRMAIELEPPPPQAEWPPGIRVRTLEPGADDERVHEANMDSFADHWEYAYVPYDRWRHLMFRSPHDPSLWFLAIDGDEIAGICLCRADQTGEPDTGWVSVLGVRPAWRRRGLGLALLRHAFGEFRTRGRERAGLGVDAENTTGAVRLYERAGMTVTRRNDIYEKPASAVAAQSDGASLPEAVD